MAAIAEQARSARVNVHVCRYVHDGLGRMIRQVCDLRVGGTGAGPLDTSNPRNPDGQIALGYVFDGNSRLVGIVDDNGNRTSFGYDALDRKTSHTFVDEKKCECTYDLDSNVKTAGATSARDDPARRPGSCWWCVRRPR